MKTIISVNGKQITTNTEFRQAMKRSTSGTRYILAEIDGEEVTIRKHWSFDGKEWDVWSGHDFATMKRLNKSVIMNLVGEPLWYTNEEGSKRCETEIPFECDWAHYNVEFEITND